jgi:hypothetical protein
MTIDIEKLREDLKQECYGAFFGGGFGGTLWNPSTLQKHHQKNWLRLPRKKELIYEPIKYDIRSYIPKI